MKTIITCILFFALCFSGQTQNLEALEKRIEKSIDSTKRDKSRITREFAKVTTGSEFSGPGNYAGISTTDQSLQASLFFLTPKSNIISFEVSAGATQGVATLFDEGELNSNVSIGVSYHWLLRNVGNSVAINSALKDSYLNAIDAEERKYEKKMLGLLQNKYVTDIEKDIAAYSNRKDALIQEKTRVTPLEASIIDDQIEEIDTLVNRLNRRISDYTQKEYYGLANLYEMEREQAVAKHKKAIEDIKPIAISLSWISTKYNIKNNKFTLFDDDLDLANQLNTIDYTSHSFSASYTHMSNAKVTQRDSDGKITSYDIRNRKYFSIGAMFDYTNNLTSLQQVEIVDSRDIGENTGRTEVIEQNAFKGNYQEDLSSLITYIDYYNFFMKDDTVALHLNPRMMFQENQKPVTTFQVGLVFPFQKKDDTSTIVNLELFYKIKDVFNITESESALLNRNIVGLQAIFPFNF